MGFCSTLNHKGDSKWPFHSPFKRSLHHPKKVTFAELPGMCALFFLMFLYTCSIKMCSSILLGKLEHRRFLRAWRGAYPPSNPTRWKGHLKCKICLPKIMGGSNPNRNIKYLFGCSRMKDVIPGKKHQQPFGAVFSHVFRLESRMIQRISDLEWLCSILQLLC